jgi:hypothetical protein
MSTNLVTAMTENPEYQQAVKRLLGVSPAIRAVISPALIDEQYISELGKNQLELQKLGLIKQAAKEDLAEKKREFDAGLSFKQSELESRGNQAAEKLALQKEIFGNTYGLESGLGLSTLQNYYNTRNNLLQNNLDLNNNQNMWSNIIGLANVGAGLYGLNKKNTLNNALTSLLASRNVG